MNLLIRSVALLWSLALTTGEVVTCFFSQDCVLPCQSPYHEIIHWQKLDSTVLNVHSFYSGADRLDHQDPVYKGRTALFPDQISNGNISLILRDVEIQDGGKYKCYGAISSANKEYFFSVNITAPIKSVDIQMTDNGITCNTSDIYPKPIISWNNAETPQPDTDITKDSNGLFSLTSTFVPESIQNGITFACTISTEDKTQSYTASLRREKIEIVSGEDLTISCVDSQANAGNFTLKWFFADSSTILSYDSQTSYPISSKWRDINITVTHEGKITLHNLDHEKHKGTYTCERTTAQSRLFIDTSVEIKLGGHMIAIIAIGIVLGILIIVGSIVIIFITKKHCGKIKTLEKDDKEQTMELNTEHQY
ncbi:HERV-H LTR-associating protein 2 [Hoplias malabaricus]|uniref:HERV-H LTR-associating protein 2 n=1 Tax=Hoplias malabaricus TaxID=27720 RepID=UPI003461C25F